MNINFENRNNVWVIVCVWQPLLGISNHLPLSLALPSHPSHLVNMYSVWRPQLLCEIPFLTRRGFHGAGTSLVSLSTKGLRTLAKGVQSREQTDEGRVPSDGLWQVQQGGRGCSAWLGFPWLLLRRHVFLQLLCPSFGLVFSSVCLLCIPDTFTMRLFQHSPGGHL